MVVVLPAPLAPMSATTVPGFTFSEAPTQHFAGAVTRMEIFHD